ncbi:MAG: hypothetical protein H0T45_03170 [Pyrinomonadaceae bacterium]|nr:hypothetical protein [Pyrinomonadaceae bacterium]
MLRPLTLRSALSLCTLLLVLSAAACSPRAENTPSSNTATTNTANSNVKQPNTPGAVATVQPASNTTAKAKLDVNAASADELLNTIPGMGKKMVHEFEEYRPYKSIQQFRREIGKYVSPEQVAEYEKYVFVPISINNSDAATLQQIPGLDAKEAEAVLAGRPYASPDAFLAKLTGSVSEAELSVAKTYLGNK